jgi:uncharacterized membrane protein YoaK (UPF0700 family)
MMRKKAEGNWYLAVIRAMAVILATAVIRATAVILATVVTRTTVVIRATVVLLLWLLWLLLLLLLLLLRSRAGAILEQSLLLEVLDKSAQRLQVTLLEEVEGLEVKLASLPR